MSKLKDPIDAASDDSFPASDPPSFTPISGVGSPYHNGIILDGNVVRVPNGRGEELRQHLAAHGIEAELNPDAEPTSERLEILGDVDLEDVQTILDQWER